VSSTPAGPTRGHGAPPGDIFVADDARIVHLERRAAALLRQLNIRIAEVAAARSERDQLRGELDAASSKATEYDRLMATKTMRLLSGPRTAYGRILGVRHRSR
jgi:hypothetical protein